MNVVGGRSIRQILGYPDDLKFRSSITLFTNLAPDDQVFKDALEKYFGANLICSRRNAADFRLYEQRLSG
jgi:uncharacterized protein (DUF1810 family)